MTGQGFFLPVGIVSTRWTALSKAFGPELLEMKQPRRGYPFGELPERLAINYQGPGESIYTKGFGN